MIVANPELQINGSGTAPPPDITTGLVHHWLFKDAEPVMADQGTGGISLNRVQPVSVSTGGGPGGQDCTNFTGGEYTNAGAAPINYHEMTHCMWFNNSIASTNTYFVHRGPSNNPAYYWLRYNAGNLEARIFNSAGSATRIAITSGITFNVATWYFIAVTNDASALKIYVDDIERASNSDVQGTLGTANAEIHIGRRWDAGGEHTGPMYSQRLYERILDAQTRAYIRSIES